MRRKRPWVGKGNASLKTSFRKKAEPDILRLKIISVNVETMTRKREPAPAAVVKQEWYELFVKMSQSNRFLSK